MFYEFAINLWHSAKWIKQWVYIISLIPQRGFTRGIAMLYDSHVNDFVLWPIKTDMDGLSTTAFLMSHLLTKWKCFQISLDNAEQSTIILQHLYNVQIRAWHAQAKAFYHWDFAHALCEHREYAINLHKKFLHWTMTGNMAWTAAAKWRSKYLAKQNLHMLGRCATLSLDLQKLKCIWSSWKQNPVFTIYFLTYQDEREKYTYVN